MTKITTTYSDKKRKKEVDTYKYTYKKNRITKEVYKSSSGSSYTYYYDSKGRNTKTVSVNSNGTKYTTTYKYNKKGYATERKEDGEAYTIISKYKYDKKGYEKECVETRTDKSTKEVTTTTYTYKRKFDKNKNVTEVVNYRNGEPYSKTVYSGFIKIKFSNK